MTNAQKKREAFILIEKTYTPREYVAQRYSVFITNGRRLKYLIPPPGGLFDYGYFFTEALDIAERIHRVTGFDIEENKKGLSNFSPVVEK